MMAQDSYTAPSYPPLAPLSSLVQQQQHQLHYHHTTKEAPKQHGSQSIPALLNNNDDGQDSLPTPVTPAARHSSILSLSGPSSKPSSTNISTASGSAICSPKDAASASASSAAPTHGAGYSSPPHHHRFSPRVLPTATDAQAPIRDDIASVAAATTPGSPVAAAPGDDVHHKGLNHSSATTEKLFACDKCDQTFSRQHNLKSHLATHSSEKPFQCDVCNLNFRRLHDLKRHKKLHTGERPHVCKDCSRPFARLDALNRHQRAEGGHACSVLHYTKISNGSSSNTSSSSNNNNNTTTTTTQSTSRSSSHSSHSRGAPTPRRPIPQLHIAHPASQPLSTLDQHHPRHPPVYITNNNNAAPSSTSSTPIIPPPPPQRPQSPPQQQPSAFRLPPLQTPTPTSPPPVTAWDRLKQENSALKAQIAQLKAQCEEQHRLENKIHDLQIENKVLRSLIMDSQRPEPEDIPALKRFRPSS